MGEPITRPGELSRLAGGDEYRLFMLEKMMAVSEEASANKEWRKSHQDADDAQFAAIQKELASIKRSAGAMSSSVGDLQKDRAQVVGVKDAIMTLAKVLGTLIAAAWAVWLTFFHKGAP